MVVPVMCATHDRDLSTDFKPFHERTITGIAGSVAVEGEGAAKIASKVLHNVAHARHTV